MTIEKIEQFNAFQSQTWERIMTTIKSVFLISGGMLTLTVGAFLSGDPPKIPVDLLPTLKCAWILLFYSISASLLLMLLLVISSYHMGVRWAKNIKGNNDKIEIISTWRCLEVVNWVIGVSAIIACLIGVGLMAYVAIGTVSA